MFKINVPVGTSRKLDTITRPEVKVNLPAEKVTVTVFNKSRTAVVDITTSATGDTIIVNIQDPPDTEFKLDAIPDDLLVQLREKGPWDVEGYCFYCESCRGLVIVGQQMHKPDCLWLHIQP